MSYYGASASPVSQDTGPCDGSDWFDDIIPE